MMADDFCIEEAGPPFIGVLASRFVTTNTLLVVALGMIAGFALGGCVRPELGG